MDASVLFERRPHASGAWIDPCMLIIFVLPLIACAVLGGLSCINALAQVPSVRAAAADEQPRRCIRTHRILILHLFALAPAHASPSLCGAGVAARVYVAHCHLATPGAQMHRHTHTRHPGTECQGSD